MGRKEDLQKQLDELNKATNALLARTNDCMTLPDAQKARMWNDVAPHVKTAVEAKIRGEGVDMRGLAEIIYAKVIKAVLGDDDQNHLDKV